MNEIIKIQGKQKVMPLAEQRYSVRSGKSGKIRNIDNEVIAKIARVAGAPKDKGAGMFIFKKVKDKVKKGEILYTVYAENEFNMGLAKEFLKKNKGYVIK